LIGWEKEARVALERGLADSDETHNVFGTYMASLFLGEIDEEMHGVEDKLAQAARHYQLAVEAVPRAHMARLALGQVLVRDGKDNGWLVARQMLEGEGAVRAAVPDPYAVYLFAQDWNLASRMRIMREWVRQ
jgi:TPR repeat protein